LRGDFDLAKEAMHEAFAAPNGNPLATSARRRQSSLEWAFSVNPPWIANMVVATAAI
jgi:hypothetical protein